MSVLLEAIDLEIERGGRCLIDGLRLEVAEGDLVYVQGVNGSGKTTLLRVLAGLSRFSHAGTVRRFVDCLYLGHQSAVKTLLSPRENLLLHASGESFGGTDAVDTALKEVGLYGYEDVPASRLSAGQQRRVNLARLFLSARPLWLLDEPFTAIDSDGIGVLEQQLACHVRGGGAVVMTSHQPLQRVAASKTVILGDHNTTGQPGSIVELADAP
ncbi:MAG: cytochrome c biogenesis heme-transporting ATPase CcmA [Pseudomonadota bacterium]